MLCDVIPHFLFITASETSSSVNTFLIIIQNLYVILIINHKLLPYLSHESEAAESALFANIIHKVKNMNNNEITKNSIFEAWQFYFHPTNALC